MRAGGSLAGPEQIGGVDLSGSKEVVHSLLPHDVIPLKMEDATQVCVLRQVSGTPI